MPRAASLRPAVSDCMRAEIVLHAPPRAGRTVRFATPPESLGKRKEGSVTLRQKLS